MDKEIIFKLRGLLRANRRACLLERSLTPVLAALAAVLTLSFFIAVNHILWLWFAAAVFIYIVIQLLRAASYEPDEKNYYRMIDRALGMDERAVTFYEISKKAMSAAANDAERLILNVAVKDFKEKISRNVEVFKSETLFYEKFDRMEIKFQKTHIYLLLLCLTLIVGHFASGVSAKKELAEKEKNPPAAEEKAVRKDAAEILDAIVEVKDNKTAASDAVAEIKRTREELKTPLTNAELSKKLKDAADKLKALQTDNSGKDVKDGLRKVENEVNELLAGKDGAKPDGEERKALENGMKDLSKLVEDYLKSSNDKNFEKLESQMRELSKIIEAKKDAIKNASKSGEKTSGNGAQTGGAKSPESKTPEQKADEKSKMKQLGRMTGKELLEALKKDKELQEMYAAIKAMSDEAESRCSGCDGKSCPGGNGQSGKDGKDGKPGKGGGGDGKEGKMTPQSLGIDIPKPGVGSSNLKERGGDAPLMAPQDRQGASKTPVKPGQWKALFEGERIGVSTEKSQVKGINDEKTGMLTVEGKSLPSPGEAGEKIKEMIRGESRDAEAFVSGEQAPENLKKTVSEYFKKLNNDYEKPSGKGGMKNGGK